MSDVAETTYTLEYPIDVDGEAIREVTLRRVKVRDVRDQDAEIAAYRASQGRPITEVDPETVYDRAVYNLSKKTGLRMDAVEALDMADFNKIDDLTSDFFGLREKTENAS